MKLLKLPPLPVCINSVFVLDRWEWSYSFLHNGWRKHPVSKLCTALEQTGFTSMLKIRLAVSRTNNISVRSVPFPLIIPHYSTLRDVLFHLPIFVLERFPFLRLHVYLFLQLAFCRRCLRQPHCLWSASLRLPAGTQLIPLPMSSFQSVGRPTVVNF